jgi:uncharacterized membrane protein YccF (DUF307 family)
VRTLLNIIWLVLSGLRLAIGYALAGLIVFILIITIPFGVQSFKLAGYALWPFGRTVVKRQDAGIGFPLAIANGKMIPLALWPFGREIVPGGPAAGRTAAGRGRMTILYS